MSLTIAAANPWYPEAWQHHPGAPVHHVSHPDRDAQCGIKWGEESMLGYTTGWRMCRNCRRVGEGS